MDSQLDSQFMKHSQRSSALWTLAPGEAMRLPIGPGPRDLQVAEGRLWLTRVGTPEAPAEDIWLQPGDEMQLESGSEWVIEGWSQGSFQLLVPPQACSAWRSRAAQLSASAGQLLASSVPSSQPASRVSPTTA